MLNLVFFRWKEVQIKSFKLETHCRIRWFGIHSIKWRLFLKMVYFVNKKQQAHQLNIIWFENHFMPKNKLYYIGCNSEWLVFSLSKAWLKRSVFWLLHNCNMVKPQFYNCHFIFFRIQIELLSSRIREVRTIRVRFSKKVGWKFHVGSTAFVRG